MRRFWVLCFVVIGMTGCSSIPMNAKIEYKEYSTPELNKKIKVYVGETMIDQGKASTSNVLTILNTIDGACFDILEGDYTERGTTKSGKMFFHPDGLNGGGVIKAALCDPAIALSINEKEKICVSTPFISEASCYEGQFKTSKKTLNSNSSFRQLLVYSGSVGQKVNISYREFSSDIARGAFTNNVEYDMSKSAIIRYKGAIIEILNYDNTSIEYVVKEHIRPDISY
jgi:hypothetical protein